MRFIVDAQLPPRLAMWIAERGHEAVHVVELGGLSMSDQWIWDLAQQRQAIVVTKDRDFVEWATARLEPPQIVWIRLGNVATRSLLGRIDAVWDQIVADLRAGVPILEVGHR